MTTQLEWALHYAKYGKGVIPIEYGSKKPTTCPPWAANAVTWKVYDSTEANLRRDFGHREANIGLRLGDQKEIERALVRSDFEWLEAQVCAKYLLPPTPWTMWRSDPNIPTGYFYYVKTGVRKDQFDAPETPGDSRGKRIGEILANGQQSIMPPSLHPDGTRYSWSGYVEKPSDLGEPAEIEWEEYRKLQRWTWAAGLLAAFRGEGILHDSALAIAGGLLKDGMEVEWVERIVEAIAAASGDKDPHDRVRCVADTVRRLEVGEDVAGWGTLIDMIGEPIVEAAKRLFFPPIRRDNEVLVTAMRTDVGNADRLVSQFGSEIRFAREWGWMVYDGTRWERDTKDNIHAIYLAKETIRRTRETAFSLPANHPDRDSLVSHSVDSEDGRHIREIVALAAADKRVWARPADFDADVWLLNTPSGTVNLKTGDLSQHDPRDMITRMTAVPYVPDLEAPKFRQFMNDVFKDDEAVVEYVMRALGMSLSGDLSEQKMMIGAGQGENGKSTLLGLILDIIGDYGADTPASTFDVEDAAQMGNDLAALTGARLVVASEAERDRILAEVRVKKITGGDFVTCRFLHHEFFSYRPQYTIWMATNHKPTIRGQDHAIWRRIVSIPFDAKFDGPKRNAHMREELLAEEGPAILSELVRAGMRWQAQGLGSAEAIATDTTSYRTSMDTLREIIDEFTEPKPNSRISCSYVYGLYSDRMKLRNERPLGMRSFSNEMARRGYKSMVSNSVRYYDGLAERKVAPIDHVVSVEERNN